jgi:hypothetical protein
LVVIADLNVVVLFVIGAELAVLAVFVIRAD